MSSGGLMFVMQVKLWLQVACLGELLCKISLIILHRKKKDIFYQVFQMRDSLLLLPIAFLINEALFAYEQVEVPLFRKEPFRITSAGFLWCFARMTYPEIYSLTYGARIISENNALLGPGLAVNYWDSCLKFIMKGNFEWCFKEFMEEFKSYLEDVELQSLKEIGLTVFPKLIILLPSDCNPPLKNEDDARCQGIYKIRDLNTEFQDTKLKFRSRIGQKEVTLNVSWIYKNKNEDEEDKRLKAEKIMFVYDFPILLKSGMGPKRGWEEGPRKENIEAFQRTLRDLSQVSEYKECLVICEYSSKDKTKKISEHLRETIYKNL